MPGTLLALLLVVRAYDMAGLSPHEMTTAERAAVDVLGRARIDVSLVACGTDPVAALLCSEVPGPAELIVRLMAAPSLPGERALADAKVDRASAAGALATVYVNRVRSLASLAGMDSGTLIGRAIAHEVGHLLLGTTHSATGLMRGVWSASALQRESERSWRFSRGEAERLKRRLDERVRPRQLTEAGVVEPIPPIPFPCTTGRGLACPAQ
jgi:hypothetical protein